MKEARVKPGFHLDFGILFLRFSCSFWFFVPTKNQNEQCNVQMETFTKKNKTSNQRHLPVLVLEIELILSQKQERAMESSKNNKRQMETRPKIQNEQQKQQQAFFIPIFIHLFQLWTYGRWLTSRVKKNQKEQKPQLFSRVLLLTI